MTNEQLKSLLPGCPEVNREVLNKVKADGLRGWQTTHNGVICAACAQRLLMRGIGGVFANAAVYYSPEGETLACDLCGELLG